MKPEGMSDKAWVELHKVIARIEAKVNAKITENKKATLPNNEKEC